jgi:hypothetical protein
MKKNRDTYIVAFDNGSSGCYTLISPKGEVVAFEHVPTYTEAKWTKPKKIKKVKRSGVVEIQEKQGHYTFIDHKLLQQSLARKLTTLGSVVAYIERPAISYNMGWGIDTSLSGMCAWYAVTTVLRLLGIQYHTVDSREWQQTMLTKYLQNQPEPAQNAKGLSNKKNPQRNKNLKIASDRAVKELFPKIVLKNKDVGDGDSLIMALFYLRKLQGK